MLRARLGLQRLASTVSAKPRTRTSAGGSRSAREHRKTLVDYKSGKAFPPCRGPSGCKAALTRAVGSSRFHSGPDASNRSREHGRGDEWWSGSGGRSLPWALGAAAAAAACVGGASLSREELKGVIQIDDIDDHYEITDNIGEGGFAVVYKATNLKTKQEVALKIMDKSNPETPLVMRDEVEVMRAAGHHDNLVCLNHTYETKRTFILDIDLANGGALFDRVVKEGKLNESVASSYILQVLQAILHMHRRKIMHGDIKPENLLLTSDDPNASIKVCDFGMARFIETGKTVILNQNTGTMDYWAPEIVKNGQCGQKIDMWALGVVTYIMLCGCNPFDPNGSATDSEILTNITQGKLDERNAMWRVLSPACKDLVTGMLTVDPAKRLSAEDALQHPWLAGGQASDKALPGVHRQRLLGYQALIRLRNLVKALHINTIDMFNAMSKNGEMDTADLKKAFKNIGTDLSDEALNAVMEVADVSGDGKIDREEFEGLMKVSRNAMGSVELNDEQLKQLFKIFDENGDGKISASEMSHVLSMLGRKMSIRRASSIIHGNMGVPFPGAGAKNTDNEAGLNFNEFKNIMTNHVFSDQKDD